MSRRAIAAGGILQVASDVQSAAKSIWMLWSSLQALAMPSVYLPAGKLTQVGLVTRAKFE